MLGASFGRAILGSTTVDRVYLLQTGQVKLPVQATAATWRNMAVHVAENAGRAARPQALLHDRGGLCTYLSRLAPSAKTPASPILQEKNNATTLLARSPRTLFVNLRKRDHTMRHF